MSTCEDMLDDLRDRLDDQGDTKFGETTKIRFLNRGQAAMFPKIYQTARDSTLALIASTFEYNIPAAVGSNSKIVELEVEGSALDSHYYPLSNYNIVPGITDPILQLKGSALPSAVGANIRITAVKPLTAFAASTDTYTGPTFSEELPVLYAMGLAMGRDVEAKLSVRRMPTIEGVTGDSEAMMTASQFWLQQFEMLLERLSMPLPAGY